MESLSNQPAGGQLTQIPRGNTQKSVYHDVLTYLTQQPLLDLAKPLRWLDAPCGEGEFLDQVVRFFPAADRWGTDRRPAPPPGLPAAHYASADLSREFPFGGEAPFDLITSISGIMCFANTAQFVANCAGRLRPGGLLIITNDNCLTVRDRLSYLFTGRLRRFRLLFEPDEGNFQLVQQQELKRLFDVHGLRLRRVFYTARYTEDLLYLPLALALWPLQWLRLRRLRSSTTPDLSRQLFGFRSLLDRHYVFVGEKVA